MNHKIRIAISRVDTPEPGTGTFTNAQLEGGEFQFTSREEVQKYLEDARKTMDEGQIKVLLTALGVESVEAALTMVATLTEEEAAAKLKMLGEMIKTADQSSTDVNMPMYTTSPDAPKIELTNVEADQIKKKVEQHILKQLDQIKSTDGSSLRDWVHQEGDLQRVLTSNEFKVKQLGYKLLTSVEEFVRGLGDKAMPFMKENGGNVRQWLTKMHITASMKAKTVKPRKARVITATFTKESFSQLERFNQALNNPEIRQKIDHQLLGDDGARLLSVFVEFDAKIRNGGLEFVLNESTYDDLVDFFDIMDQHISGPALLNCGGVIEQLEVATETEFKGDFEKLNELGDNGHAAEDTMWETFLEQNDDELLLDPADIGNFHIYDENGITELEWEAVLEDLEGASIRLERPVEEVEHMAHEMQRLNQEWTSFYNDYNGPASEEFRETLNNLDQQWYNFSQEQVLKELADAIEVIGAPTV